MLQTFTPLFDGDLLFFTECLPGAPHFWLMNIQHIIPYIFAYIEFNTGLDAGPYTNPNYRDYIEWHDTFFSPYPWHALGSKHSLLLQVPSELLPLLQA